MIGKEVYILYVRKVINGMYQFEPLIVSPHEDRLAEIADGIMLYDEEVACKILPIAYRYDPNIDC